MAADFSSEGEEPTLTPVIRDILRTRYCIPGSLFVVEGVEELSPTKGGRWRAIRMLLGDGELCIQVLLGADMHRYFDSWHVPVGCYVQLHEFSLCSREVSSGDTNRKGGNGQLVYLVVDDFTVAGWSEEYALARGLTKALKGRTTDEEIAVDERLDTPVHGVGEVELLKPDIVGPEGASGAKEVGIESEESDDGFDAPSAPKTAPTEPPAPPTQSLPKMPMTLSPVALPRDWTDPNVPLKLTTLASIPNLPYKQNWSVNVLAVVASISEVEPSTLPPYRQRSVRLADPSTQKRVHLTVFLDPDEFSPKAGRVVLLAGVKNHRFDGGSLKKYVSDRPKNGLSWWYEEPDFVWCNTAEMTRWWASTGEH